MPTNLPPEYFEAERRYKAAGSPEEKFTLLQELIATIPKHKGTDKLRADLRKKLSRLKAAVQQAKKKTGRHESPYHIEREGAGRAVLTGPTNVGKSALLAALTHAAPKVSEAPYTTWAPTPGMMAVKDIQIQLIDTPPLYREHIEPEMMDLIRTADLILLVIDLRADPFQQLEESIAILEENHISPCFGNSAIERRENFRFIKSIVVVNKVDDFAAENDFQAFTELLERNCRLIPLSARQHRNFRELERAIFEELDIIRVYSKPPGKEPEMSAPFVLPRNSTVNDFAINVHKDFAENLKTARVWGTGVYDGQPVSREHILHDGDVVELHI